jgi:AraC-like DNA-binding protein
VPLPPDASILLHRQFDDFDELATAARHWDLDLMQLDRGKFEGDVVQAVSTGVLFSEARFGRKLTQQGAAPEGMRSFVLPATDNVRFKWRGKDIGPNDLLTFPRSGELYAISKSDFHVFTISVPEERLEQAASMAGESRLSALLCRERTSCSRSIVNPIRKRLHSVSHALKCDRPTYETSAALEALQSVIPQLIVTALAAANGSLESPFQNNRATAAQRAQAFVSEFRDWPLSVRQLSQAIGLSERSLQYAFLEQFGVTPKSYITSFRLHHVRRELKRSKPGETKICEIASRWGFWHMGQFAADYRQRFGELPSQTLADFNSVR